MYKISSIKFFNDLISEEKLTHFNYFTKKVVMCILNNFYDNFITIFIIKITLF